MAAEFSSVTCQSVARHEHLYILHTVVKHASLSDKSFRLRLTFHLLYRI